MLDINEGLISNETKNISLEDELSEFFEQNFAIPFDNEEGYKERDNLIEIYDERIDLIEQLLKCSLEDELKQNSVTLKNMITGNQELVKIEDLVKTIKEM